MGSVLRSRLIAVRPQLAAVFLAGLCVGLALVVLNPNWLVGADPNPGHRSPILRLPGHLQYDSAVLADSTATPAPATDCQQVHCLALTFDDGPNPLTTPCLLYTSDAADDLLCV